MSHKMEWATIPCYVSSDMQPLHLSSWSVRDVDDSCCRFFTPLSGVFTMADAARRIQVIASQVLASLEAPFDRFAW
jgi:hypothetical protein